MTAAGIYEPFFHFEEPKTNRSRTKLTSTTRLYQQNELEPSRGNSSTRDRRQFPFHSPERIAIFWECRNELIEHFGGCHTSLGTIVKNDDSSIDRQPERDSFQQSRVLNPMIQWNDRSYDCRVAHSCGVRYLFPRSKIRGRPKQPDGLISPQHGVGGVKIALKLILT